MLNDTVCVRYGLQALYKSKGTGVMRTSKKNLPCMFSQN